MKFLDEDSSRRELTEPEIAPLRKQHVRVAARHGVRSVQKIPKIVVVSGREVNCCSSVQNTEFIESNIPSLRDHRVLNKGSLPRNLPYVLLHSSPHVRSVIGRFQSYILMLASNPDIRSARLYGQFNWTKHGPCTRARV